MKKTPEMEKLDNFLRSSRIVAGGFMGEDIRDVDEVIVADTRSVERLGYSLEQVAARMHEITHIAKEGLGVCVDVGAGLKGCVDEAKGRIVCPWPHPASFDKRLTTVTDVESGKEITWSDLHIHLIEEHGFFEGIGSAMRIEPVKLITIIF
ncbi:MAG: hypothetical protein FVQ82_04420 [Planctomycetes bacterium]|nr:hypothetical protein [Planctomycetota bacterium]